MILILIERTVDYRKDRIMSKTAVFLPSFAYFTTSAEIEGADAQLIEISEHTSARRYTYSTGALEAAVVDGASVYWLETDMGTPAVREYLAGVLAAGDKVTILDFTGFVEIHSLRCMDVLSRLYQDLGLKWKDSWTTWLAPFQELWEGSDVFLGNAYIRLRKV